MVDLLWHVVERVNVLVLPVPREVIERLVKYSLSGVKFSDALRLLQETVLRPVYHRGAWVRVMIPLLELLYVAVKVRPDIEVKSVETLSDLYVTDYTTIDLIRFILRRVITDDIARYIHERLTSYVERALYESADRLAELAERRESMCILATSCVLCVACREVFPSSDLVSICVSAPPPMQLMSQLALAGELTVDQVKLLYQYLRKYILDYVVSSSFLSEAYVKFMRENPEYEYLARRLFNQARLCTLGRRAGVAAG